MKTPWLVYKWDDYYKNSVRYEGPAQLWPLLKQNIELVSNLDMSHDPSWACCKEWWGFKLEFSVDFRYTGEPVYMWARLRDGPPVERRITTQVVVEGEDDDGNLVQSPPQTID